MTTLDFTCVNSVTPPGDGYVNALTLTLASVEYGGVNVAPVGLWFEVTNIAGADTPPPQGGEIRDRQYHEIMFVWDFGDPANDAPVTDLNIPAEWKHMNIGYGKRTAHVYNDPGTYTITCTAYEPMSRKFGVATIQHTVQDPDVLFAGNRTVIYDPASLYADGAAAGYPGANVTRTLTNWYAARMTLGATTARMLVAPGDHTYLHTDARMNLDTVSNWRVGAVDPAQRPRFIFSGLQGGGKTAAIWYDDDTSPTLCQEFVFSDIDFVGEWDPSIDQGLAYRPFTVNKQAAHAYFKYGILYNRSNLSGFDSLRCLDDFGNSSQYVALSCMSELSVTDWKNYALTYGTSPGLGDYHVKGCRLHHNLQALNGGRKDGFYGQHGPIRDFNSRNLLVSVTSGFSRVGWSSGGGSDPDDGQAIPEPQPIVRINANGEANKRSYIERVYCEGGGLYYSEQDSTGIDVPGNHIAEKVVIAVCAGPGGQEPIQVTYGGTTVRNCAGYIFPTPKYGNTSTTLVLANAANGDASNGAAGLECYNNTLVDMRVDADIGDEDDTSNSSPYKVETVVIDPSFTMQASENNITHQPNRSPAELPFAPMDVATMIPGVTSYYAGPRFNFAWVPATIAEDMPIGSPIELFIPYSQISEDRMSTAAPPYSLAVLTNQSYWQQFEDVDTRHRMILNGQEDAMYVADGSPRGTFGVSFDADGVRITNNTVLAWTAGWAVKLLLDRTSRLPAAKSLYSNAGSPVPWMRPTSGSPALGTAVLVPVYDDALGVVRPVNGADQGWLQT